MKQRTLVQRTLVQRSHPAGVRGLKPMTYKVGLYKTMVAPRRGAWVETPAQFWGHVLHFVAPRRGAWVETYLVSLTGQDRVGRTPQGCVG